MIQNYTFRSIAVAFLFLSLASNAQKIAIREYLETENQYHHLSGVVLATGGDQDVVYLAFGHTDANQKEQNTLETRFDIGSMSKQFTAAAILDLMDQGKLALDQPINSLLGELGSKRWEKVQVKHLLAHQSGILSLFNTASPVDVMPSEEAVPLVTLISYFQDARLDFKPGHAYSYSNSGYVLLAAIIESVSGQPFGDYMNDFFQRMGLKETTFGTPATAYAKATFGYLPEHKKEGMQVHPDWMVGAGGVFSTASDLEKWIRLIHSDDFLSSELNQEYLKGHVKKRNGSYGFGWEFLTREDGDIMWHDGANFGYVSYIGYQKSTDRLLIILTNQTFESITTIGLSADYLSTLQKNIWDLWDGKEIESLPFVQGENSALFTGMTYEFANGEQLRFTKDCETFLVETTSGLPVTNMIYNEPLTGEDPRITTLQKTASFLQKGKNLKLASISNTTMKIGVYTGIFKWAFGQLTGEGFEAVDSKAYYLGDNYGKIRLIDEGEILDLRVYFNDDNKVQGIFQDNWYEPLKPESMRAYTTGKGEVVIDGMPYAMPTGTIRFTSDGLELTILNRTFLAKAVK